MANSVDFRVPRTARDSEDYEQLFCDVTEAIWPDGQEAEALAHIAQGTPGQRALFVTTLFARLVDNGGLAGFFGPAGFYCDDVTEGLRLLGAHDMHKAFLEGLSIITKGEAVPMDGEAREGMIYRLSGRDTELLDSIDDRLYQDSSVEASLFPNFKQYTDAHPDEFFRG